MSKWRDEFSASYGTTTNVKRITKEIQKECSDKEMNKIFSDTIKGKYGRKK